MVFDTLWLGALLMYARVLGFALFGCEKTTLICPLDLVNSGPVRLLAVLGFSTIPFIFQLPQEKPCLNPK